jgi:hypothetical protein
MPATDPDMELEDDYDSLQQTKKPDKTKWTQDEVNESFVLIPLSLSLSLCLSLSVSLSVCVSISLSLSNPLSLCLRIRS